MAIFPWRVLIVAFFILLFGGTESIYCAFPLNVDVSVFFGKDVLVKHTVAPRRDQLDVSSHLINAPIRISLDSTNMHAHSIPFIFLMSTDMSKYCR